MSSHWSSGGGGQKHRSKTSRTPKSSQRHRPIPSTQESWRGGTPPPMARGLAKGRKKKVETNLLCFNPFLSLRSQKCLIQPVLQVHFLVLFLSLLFSLLGSENLGRRRTFLYKYVCNFLDIVRTVDAIFWRKWALVTVFLH